MQIILHIPECCPAGYNFFSLAYLHSTPKKVSEVTI